MAVTLAMIDGFEHGLITTGAAGVYDVAAGTPAVNTTLPRTGLRSLEMTASAAAESRGYNVSSTIVSMAFYVRFASLPGADSQLASFLNANGNGVFKWDITTGRFQISAGTGADVEVGPNPVATGTWYRVTLEYDTSTGAASLRCKVGSDTEQTATATQASASNTVVRLGTIPGHTYTAYFDDWLISVTDGDYEQLRDMAGHSIESLAPSADGTHNITTSGDFDSFTTTAYSNSTTTSWQQLDDRPIKVLNTADAVIRQDLGTTANYMEHTLGNLSAGTDTPIAVRTYAVHVESSATGTTLAEAQLLLADNTEVLTTGSLSAIDSTQDVGTTITTTRRMAIAPSGGWDRTKVDGLKDRVGFGDNNPDVNFLSFLVEVALEEAAGGTPATVTPATIARAFTIEQAAPQGAVSVTPATISRSFTTPTTGAQAASSVTPATVARSFTVPQASAGVAASVTPATVARSFTTPQASPQAGASVVPATVARAFTIPQASASITANVIPATIARAFVIAQASPQAGASVTPATVAHVFVLPQASPQAGASVVPATVAWSFTIDQATTDTGGTGAISDTFNRADSGTLGTADTGQTWTSNVGTWQIVSNQASQTSATGSAQASLDTGTADQVVEADLLHATAQQHVMARYTTMTSGYIAGFQASSNTLSLWKFNPGFTNIANYAAGTHTGRVKLSVQGSGNIEVWLDGVSRITSSDAAITTGNRAGLFGTSALVDNFNANDTGGATVTPATIARSFVLDQALAQAGATVTPATIARAFTVPQASPLAAVSVTPATIAKAFAILQAAVQVGANVTPATVARAFTILQASPQAGASVTPATIARAFVIPQATAGVGANVTPATVARAFTILQATAQAGASITPATIARAFGVPQASAQTGLNVTPATISRAFTLPQAATLAGSSVTPATIARAFLIPQATPTGGAPGSVTPATIARAFVLPQAQAKAGAAVTPATLALLVAIPQAAAKAGASVTPATIAMLFTIPQANAVTGMMGVPVIGAITVFTGGGTDADFVGAGASSGFWGGATSGNLVGAGSTTDTDGGGNTT